MPAFPSAGIKLLSLLSNDECSLSTIAGCIATDAVLAGRLIRRANAGDQPRYCEARDVMQAVLALGLDRTRDVSLAIATSVFASAAIKSAIWRPCWHHTLASALAASEVAGQCGLRPVELYTAALLHDIGRLGLLAAYPEEYEMIMAGANGEIDELLAIERARFGVNHVEAGVWLARRWNLPESIVEVIARHHEPPTGERDEVAVVQIACRLADLLGFGAHQSTESPDLDEIGATLPEWTGMRPGVKLGALQEAIAGEIRLLEGAESPLPESADAKEDGGEREEEPPVWSGQQDLPSETPARWYQHGGMVAAAGAAIVLLLSVALLLVLH